MFIQLRGNKARHKVMEALVLTVLTMIGLPVAAAGQQIAMGGYTVPTWDAVPQGITAGPDGALWFCESLGNKIGRITPAGTITEYAVPTYNDQPVQITNGSDGALWFTEQLSNKIGRITTDGTITEYLVGSASYSITQGPDGALWFTEGNGNIGRITTSGVFTEYVISPRGNSLSSITSGPDEALWFTDSLDNRIGRMTTAGVVTQYDIPTANSLPNQITTGPDGALWFTEFYGVKIGRVTIGGVFNEYPIPGAASAAGITAGPDGALWFTENSISDNSLGRITTSGAISQYPALAGYSYIARGPDNELWLTGGTYQIGEAVFVTANLTSTPSSGTLQTKLDFTGSAYTPSETVLIFKNGVGSTVMASAKADENGGFTATGFAPTSPYGARLFLGVGQTSGKLGAANFNMKPRLILNPSTGGPGSAATASGTGFDAFVQVDIYWNGTKDLGAVFADFNGAFKGSTAIPFKIPSNAPPGPHRVKASDSTVIANATFTVQ